MPCWYGAPLGVPLTPSQHSSFNGMRTAWMFQVFMASTDAWSTGPLSHSPLPCTQANSALERSTPSSRYVLPAEVTILLPDTCSFGAGPVGCGDELVLGVGDALLRLGVGLLTVPVHALPLSANDVGTGLAPLHVPTKPTEVDAPVL